MEKTPVRSGNRKFGPAFGPFILGVFLVMLLLPVLSVGAQAAPLEEPQALGETELVIEDVPAEGTGAPEVAESGVGIWDVIRMIFILGIVVALVYAFLFFMKKASKLGTTSLEGVKVLGSQVLSGNRVLYVVDVEGEVLLLGAGDSSVTLLKEITDPEVRDSLRLQASRQQTTSLTFQEILKKFTRSPKTGEDKTELSADSGKTSVDFLKKQRERLKNL